MQESTEIGSRKTDKTAVYDGFMPYAIRWMDERLAEEAEGCIDVSDVRSHEQRRGEPHDTREEQARDVMRQLNLKGEIDWPASQPVGHIDFSVARPNGAAQVRIDLNAKQAYIKAFENGALHAFQIFHTFSGSRFNQPASRRDWIVTSVWVLAMDALAVGLVVMVLGSYYMWWRLKKRKALGVATLFIGVLCCAVFVAGVL
jgi:hypothetical protein